MKKWDKEEEGLLLLWMKQAWSYSEVALELDRTKQSVKNKYRTLTNSVYSIAKMVERNRQYVSKNIEHVKNYQKQYKTSNKGSISDYNRQYYIDNKPYIKEQQAKYRKQYYQNNKNKYAGYVAKRRAAKLSATPKWADLEGVKEFYDNKPEGYHVDHIVPLQGEKVCGLHILENLQYLTAIENMSKGNKFEI
jgi:hypothetical protein